jgi:hypothetical protein
MSIENIQHGGNHYKNMPKHLQPIYLATALGLNPMEYSVLKYLLRHRKKGGLLDLKKMMHFGQMLLEQEYNTATEIIYLDEPIDAKFEIVPPADPPQAECPFKIGDMVELKAKPGEHWRVTFVDSAGFDLTSPTNSQSKRFIWRYGYDKYQLVAAVGNDAIECPFKLGDIIAKPNSTGWKIDRILSDRLHVTSDDPYRTPSQIDRQFWLNYRIVTPTTLDATQQTC